MTAVWGSRVLLYWTTQSAEMCGPITEECCLGIQVKPQYLDGVLEALQPHVTPNHLIVSIAAGVRLASLEAALPEGSRVVRQPFLAASADLHHCHW